MIRYINISNDKNRDAEITFKSLNPKPAIKMGLESGDKIINKKVLIKNSIVIKGSMIKF